MIKRLFAIILALALIVSLIGCGQTPTITPTDAGTAPGENNPTSPSNSENSTTSPSNEATEPLTTCEVLLPAEMFAGEDMENFDFAAYAEENGFLSANANEDGTVTVIMSSQKYTEFLNELALSVETSLSALINAENTPYIKDITHNEDFTAVDVKVDRVAYESAYDFTPLAIAMLVAVYQGVIQQEFHVDVTILDNATGEVIKTVTMPDSMSG